MQFENSFEVPLPPAEAWNMLIDIPRITPCMPGAELTEIVDPRTFKGKISVRLGPVALAFAGTVIFEEIDNVERRARVKAQGADAKGRGGAHAVSTFQVQPAQAGSKVLVRTNLSLSGAVAQYGRGVGMIQATAAQLMQQFAQRLQAQLQDMDASAARSGETEPANQIAERKPISGLSLLAKVLWQAIVKLFAGPSRPA
jgi:uncharacterized protein